ncbi:SnoaL-like domain protein [Pseudovibrio axinellae]|uniref:SnoaL-like domain protein n=1 Tax=Pseudovibrio axinellae TaxID=989403 RepID=A0A165WRF0_9HYPH|nr:nuclear transport factor 2 family protein [Pseudovibrio axinellae]KZL16812.1 SnoaL-like domain protein [Pseudovibrio axinellae]SER68287.1 SnoaL-like domain-containing protein [Pseudovibrio axinellae]
MSSKHETLIKSMLIDLLEQQRIDRVTDYFTEDALLMINNTRLVGIKAILQRLAWIRDNQPALKLSIKRVFFNGDEGFEHHESEATNDQGETICFKLFSFIQMRDDKVCRYEVVAIQTIGQGDIGVTTAINV